MGTGEICSVGGFLSTERVGLGISCFVLFLERFEVVSWIVLCGMGLCPGWTVHSAGI